VECIYCATRPATTSDHVPPKQVFPRPLPSNLITVPSCDVCNGGFQSDDDYFGAIMAMRVEIEPHPGGDEVVARLMRGFDRPESRGLVERFIAARTTKSVYAKDDGRYLGEAEACELETHRIQSTLARIVRGLHYHETGTRLGEHVEVVADISIGEKPDGVTLVRRALTGQPVQRVGHSFAYVWKSVDSAISHTAWLLQFYQRVPFFVMTADRSVLEARRELRAREA
jgi:hypothetical protein